MSCTLDQYAEAKGLPVSFLETLGLSTVYLEGKPTVRMPYTRSDGTEAAVKFRLNLTEEPRSKWRSGSKPSLYGLAGLEPGEEVFLVEGESDTQTLRYYGLPAVGLPGASQWRDDRDAPYLEDYARIYVVVEPDKGGETLLEHLAGSRLLDRFHLVDLEEVKDVSALHLDDPQRFRERLEEAVARAVPLRPLVEQKREAERLERGAAAFEVCAELVHRPRILDDFASELPRLGLVGETRNARVLFLALVSRLLPRIVSVAVKGQSSSGKSFETEVVLRFFPADAFAAFTAVSERALLYGTDSLSHRLLVFFEADGAGGDFLSYIIRSLLSEGELRYETTEKDPKTGEFRTRLIVREGPTGLVVTTTRASLHPENETRLVSLYVDDSPEQTASVLEALAGEERGEVDLARWHALQDWLAAGPTKVSVPYARVLARAVPPVAVRLRRDFAALLGFIRAHALLHRASRDLDDRGQVVATLDDYEVVRELVADVLSLAVSATVKPETRETVRAVYDLLASEPRGATVTVAKVRERLNQGRSQPLDARSVRYRMSAAISAGYLSNEAPPRKPYEVKVGDPMPEDLQLLPSRTELERRWRGNEEMGGNGAISALPPEIASAGAGFRDRGNEETETGGNRGDPSPPTPGTAVTGDPDHWQDLEEADLFDSLPDPF